MKYLEQKSFSVGGYGKDYEKNYDAVFGKKKPEGEASLASVSTASVSPALVATSDALPERPPSSILESPDKAATRVIKHNRHLLRSTSEMEELRESVADAFLTRDDQTIAAMLSFAVVLEADHANGECAGAAALRAFVKQLKSAEASK